ncbi:peptidase S8/S53 domain-containing protein [Chaetomium sp. MPI-CAGE-AT-0009]|nr:peptidase S8/S53 domain-containing protein [Chaetomium sp. MPI-CAGE-AT-0009]
MADAHEDDFLESDEDFEEQQHGGFEERPDPREQLELVDKIINGEIHVDLEDNSARDDFLARYKHCFMGGKEGTLLHVALQNCNQDRDYRLKPLFKLVIGEYPEILQARNALGVTVLHFAIEMGLSAAAKYLCKRAPPEAAASAIGCSGREGGNCIHAAIRYGRNLDVIAYFISACGTSAARDGDDSGRTPLHYAVCLENRPRRWLSSTDTVSRKPREGHRPRRTREWEWNVPDDDEDSSDPAVTDELQIIRLLIEKNPRSLVEVDANGLTPYQARIRHLQNAIHMISASRPDRPGAEDEGTGASEPTRNPPPSFGALLSEDPMATVIRDHCMRSGFSLEEILKCLYKPGEEREITFDLSGLPRPVISEDYLVRLGKHLKFESVLQYVAIPRLTIETSESRPGFRTMKVPNSANTDLVPVFDWLRSRGVKKILKLTVVDDQEPSHTDSSIERALRGFDVEIWDWKQADLNSDVIYYVAPRARVIHLYSTGNNAVLMGWASPYGLPKFDEGRESRDRLERYLFEFRESIAATRIPGFPAIVVRCKIIDDGEVGLATGLETWGTNQQEETSWVDCIRNFAALVRRAPKFRETRPVRIAVIDDGIDGFHGQFDGKIAAGISLCPESAQRMSPYYISSTGHGTHMASIITTLCPNVDLYIAKLNARQIDAKVAIKAIRWAIQCRVDIISISWAIPLSPDNHDAQELQEAVYHAEKEGISLFCARTDDGTEVDRSYPADFQDCISIGAAAEDRRPLGVMDSSRVDFLLPGKVTLPMETHTGDVIPSITGSSIATAAAVGLAGLLVFCDRLLGNDRYQQKSRDAMCAAFEAMSRNEGDKFPRVQQFFESGFLRELATRRGQATLKSRRVSEVEWDDSCTQALSAVMDSLTRRR